MRKFYLFFVCLVCLFCIFSLKVNASTSYITLQATYYSQYSRTLYIHSDIQVDVGGSDYGDTYFIDLSYLVDDYNLTYSTASVSVKYGRKANNEKNPYSGPCSYDTTLEGVLISFAPPSEAMMYYVEVAYTDFNGLEYEDVPDNLATLTPRNPAPTPSVFSTTASITMSETTKKGTVSGSISFASNTYEAGWYVLDLNYVKEFYQLASDITSASITCPSNQTLNQVLSDSMVIDNHGNVIYFPLPSLNNVTDTINYTVTFGGSDTGLTNNEVGAKVKITKVTSGTSNQAVAFSAENYSIRVNVDSPISINQMMEVINLRAIDGYNGQVNIGYNDPDEYVSHVVNRNVVSERELGTYNITFTASDTNNNGSSLLVRVIVEDTVAPAINTSQSTLQYDRSYTESAISKSTLENAIRASDNYSDFEDLIVSVDYTNYSTHYNVVNTYILPLTVTDPSGNVTNGQITIRVIDDIAPVISGSNTFDTSYTSDITANEIVNKCNITASDAIDDSVEVGIIGDTYSSNKYTPGNYSIIVQATDDSENSSTFTINVNVTDNIKPYFLINKTTLVVENGYAYTPNEILDAAISSGLIRADYTDVEVVVDEYTNNESTEGTYLYRLRVTYNNGLEEYVDINLHVLGEDNEIVKVKWYVKIGNFFTRTFTKIGHFFSDIVYEKGIKKVFEFVKSTWNKLFRR